MHFINTVTLSRAKIVLYLLLLKCCKEEPLMMTNLNSVFDLQQVSREEMEQARKRVCVRLEGERR